jgi:outer membrane lipoprotein LolB
MNACKLRPSAEPLPPAEQGRSHWVAGAALALSWLLTSCASPRMPVDDPQAYWSGRMAIQVLKHPPESMSASFELQGSAQKGELLMLSPIGTTLARLVWTPDWAQLTQGSQAVESSNLPTLVERLTGTELPIAALFEWLAGRPAQVPGWHADLSGHAQGRISAERLVPTPATAVRIVLDR